MASNRKRSRGWIKAYNMGQGEGPTVPIQSVYGREWPLNCMTVISAWWRLNIRFQRSSGWSPHPTEGALGNPDGVDPSIRRTRKTQRDGHNSGVKILQFMFGLQLPLTCNPWTILSNPCNKVRGKYICKEVFVRLPSRRRLFLRLSLSLRRNYGVVMMLHEYADDNTTRGRCIIKVM